MEGSTKIKRTKPFKGKSIIENYVFFILLDIICLFYFKNEDIKIIATYTLIRMDIMVFSMLLIILKILKRYFMEFKSFISLVFFDDLDDFLMKLMILRTLMILMTYQLEKNFII